MATSTALCKMCIEQLQLLLANAQKAEGELCLENDIDPNDLGSYFMKFLSTLRNIPSVSLFRFLSEEDEKAFKEIQEMESRLSREGKNCVLPTDANKLHALRYLLIQLLLQLLLHPGEFSEAASELTICCKKALGSSPDFLGSAGEGESDDDAVPELMDVLVDTLLSLLPQSSAPTGSAIEQVFKCFCHDITDDGLLQMLRVIKKDLKPVMSKFGYIGGTVGIRTSVRLKEFGLDGLLPKDLALRHSDIDSDDLNDEEEDCLAIEEEEEDEIDEAEIGETGESDGQTDDSEAVVRVEAANRGLPGNSNDSDGGMDDDAMFRMDTCLAQIFKERKNQPGSETAQSQLVLFKLRVLSLLEIYQHENPGQCLHLLLRVANMLNQIYC